MRSLYFKCPVSLSLILLSVNLFSQRPNIAEPQRQAAFDRWVDQVRVSDELGTSAQINLRAAADGSLDAQQAPNVLQALYAMEGDDIVVFEKTINYKGDLSVARYQRYYNGIKVEHSDYAVLLQAGKMKWVNGEHYILDGVKTTPSMSEEQALTDALQTLDSELYAWESTEQLLATHRNLEPGKRKALEVLMEEEYPTGELVIVRDFSRNEAVVDLAYKFTIESVTPLFKDEVYVNAHDGHIMMRNPLIKHGTGDTRYAGTRTFPTTEESPAVYELKGTDPISGVYCDTRSLEGVGGLPLSVGALYTLASPIQDGDETEDPCLLEDPPIGETGDDTWNAAEHRKALFGSLCCPQYTPGGDCNEYNNDDIALDAQWGAAIVAQYWMVEHGRSSYDDNGADIFSFVHYGDGYDNAFWNGSYMTYGDGSYQGGTNPDGSFAPLSSMDVCAHEIGHAVCTSTSDLAYQRESGAMNEGFSDIWAAAIERYVLDSIDATLEFDPWGIGEQIDERDGGLPPGTAASRALRWMDDPKAAGDPDTYGGTNWIDPDCPEPNLVNDYCGVHTNSGVLNKWYYLLTMGSGKTFSPGFNKAAADDETNDNGDAYSVTGLGFAKSDLIAFGGEILLTSNAKFLDMREASIEVARTLFGPCSFEEIQTTNAWHAVGVGDTFQPCVPKIEFNVFNPSEVSEKSQSVLCNAQSIVTLGLYSFMANQTINLVTSGNAIAGVDFDLATTSITMNGTEIQYFDMIVYDDKVVEATPDTVIIAFNDGGFSDTMQIVIIDDDVIPKVGGVYTLVSETFDVSTTPAGWQHQLINPASANQWQFNGTGTEAGRAFAAIPGSPTAVYNQTADANIRLATPLLDARGQRNVTISFDWEAGGENDAVDTTILYDYGTFQISEDGSTWTDIEDYVGTAGGNITQTGTYNQIHPELDGKTFYLGFRWYNDALVGSGFSFAIDNVVVTAEGLEVATAVGASMEANLPLNSTVPFVNASDFTIIGEISETQGDLGCTELRIDENNGSADTAPGSICDLRSTKVFEVATPNTTDSFRLELYFKTSEVDVWSSPELLNILAVENTDIDDATATIHIIPNASITVDDQRATNGYISYSFMTTAAAQTYALTDRKNGPVNRTVLNANDVGANSLRERVDAACPADTIRFDPALGGDTIRLVGQEIQLDKNLVIIGLGVDILSISGEETARVFQVKSGAEVHIYDVELREGAEPVNGGAILNKGILKLSDVRLRMNFENGVPAGLTNTGTLTVDDSVVIDK